jgi:hypothetical protein
MSTFTRSSCARQDVNLLVAAIFCVLSLVEMSLIGVHACVQITCCATEPCGSPHLVAALNSMAVNLVTSQRGGGHCPEHPQAQLKHVEACSVAFGQG